MLILLVVCLFGQLCDGLTALRRKIQYPLNLDLTRVKGKFQFLPPSGVKVIGGFLLGTLIKPDLCVDITLHMPVVSDWGCAVGSVTCAVGECGVYCRECGV